MPYHGRETVLPNEADFWPDQVFLRKKIELTAEENDKGESCDQTQR